MSCDSTHVGLVSVVKGWQASGSGACRRPALSGCTDVSGDMMIDGVPGVRGAQVRGSRPLILSRMFTQ